MWLPAVLLGVATIGAYGTAQYAIGTLIPAIAAEEHWRTGTLSAGYAVAVLVQGAVAILAGREFDRSGSRRVVLPALLLGSAALLAASYATSAWLFVLAWGLGGAIFGGGLYYSMTMPAVVRLYPHHRAQALAVLTLIGALAAPLFSPLAAILVEAFGWRMAIRGLVFASAVCVLPAALLVRAPGGASTTVGTGGDGTWGEMLRVPAVRRVLIVLAVGGMANHVLLLHQVSALQAAGLSLAAASSFAGARGGFQLLGRILLAPLTRRLGTRGAMALCYAVAATSALSVLVLASTGGWLPVAAYFAVVGGMSLGLLSPLAGLLQAETYGDVWLGRLNGVSVIVVSVAGAAGAWAAGVFAEATRSFLLPMIVIAGLQLLAVLILAGQRRHSATAAGQRGVQTR